MAIKNPSGTDRMNDGPSKDSGVDDIPFDWATLPDLAKNRWEEAVAFDLTVETQLSKAQASRGQAEIERQRVAGEILEATREVCHEIAADARQALESARRMEIDAVRKHLEAESALKQAESAKADAASHAEMVIDRARQDAAQIMERTRVNAEKEAEEISQRTTLQSRKILVQVETMKPAAQEEMETQRIYTQVARLKAESLESLSEVRGWIWELPSTDPAGAGSSGPDEGPQAESPAQVLSQTGADTDWAPQDQSEEPAMERSQEPSDEQAGAQVNGAVLSGNGSKPAERKSRKEPGRP